LGVVALRPRPFRWGAFEAIFEIEGGAAMKTVPPVTQARPMREELPARVQEALGELAAAAREGLLALSVGVGLGVHARTPRPPIKEAATLVAV
jgi:hypothetical protein